MWLATFKVGNYVLYPSGGVKCDFFIPKKKLDSLKDRFLYGFLNEVIKFGKFTLDTSVGSMEWFPVTVSPVESRRQWSRNECVWRPLLQRSYRCVHMKELDRKSKWQVNPQRVWSLSNIEMNQWIIHWSSKFLISSQERSLCWFESAKLEMYFSQKKIVSTATNSKASCLCISFPFLSPS